MEPPHARRRKRDTVENIYRHCALSGTCPDDVKNKVENNTIADRILKWIASIVYFGGLGIGTGRGSGGSMGYTPVGAGGGRVTSQGTVLRPGVVLDPVGPSDIVPIDPISPTASSIVPLETVPETQIPDVPVRPPVGGELEVTVGTDPVSDITIEATSPAITPIDPTSAVIEAQPPTSTPKRVSVTSTRHVNPSYISVYGHPTDPVTQAGAEVFVGAAVGEGRVISIGESIPLDTFVETGGSSTFSIEEAVTPPRTSTPRVFQRAFQRARDLYNRRVQQVQTHNMAFLGRPRQAVTFEFENPAFQDEVTQQFEQDLQSVAAAPDPDFADIVTLGRPRFSETAEGRVRLSRLGRRGTIVTRSGLQIGSNVHFYYDFSSIDAGSVELQPLGQQSGVASIVDGLASANINGSAETSFIEGHTLVGPTGEADLYDTYSEEFGSSRLLLTPQAVPAVQVPPLVRVLTLPPGTALQILLSDVGGLVPFSVPSVHPVIPGTVFPDVSEPPIVVDGFDAFDTFYLHPSHRRKRKRKRSGF
ncbi:L2 protein [human papillomavirus 101]|uniref:Minor capsid protein L2 n=1 Tax=human papillomavirus 101 TaxID=915425 RepID=Q1AHR8_9PAPI|nr:L2 protein [human papillomavirus 101]AAZ39511.1 L2 protein [human papillomavirus 101]